MLLCISESKRATPGSTEYKPRWNIQVLTQVLHIRTQMPGCVLLETGVWSAATTRSLVENNDSVVIRIKESSGIFITSSTRPTMYKNGRLPIRVPALFEVNFMYVGDSEITRIEWFDCWVKLSSVVPGLFCLHLFSPRYIFAGYVPPGAREKIAGKTKPRLA